jgi:hypothetical protein
MATFSRRDIQNFETFQRSDTSARMAAIGMMDAAFFVGKNELLNWLNDLLQLNYTKVSWSVAGSHW